MSQELSYTSVPRGLDPSKKGFCTVTCSRGMSPLLAERLESLSGYQAVFPPQDPRAPRNPVNYSHLRVAVSGREHGVLSRVCFAGIDYSGRSNKFAHHVVVDPAEAAAAPGGPAWVMMQPGVMEAEFTGQPRTLPKGRAIPSGMGVSPMSGSGVLPLQHGRDARATEPPAPCKSWERIAGDAGWAGVLAEAWMADPNRPAFVVFEPGTGQPGAPGVTGSDMLSLMGEALSLIPEPDRWSVTFSTYFSNLPPGTSCQWRGCLPSSKPLADAKRVGNALIVDLTGPLGSAKGGALVEQARTGKPASIQPRAGRDAAFQRKAPSFGVIPAEETSDLSEALATLDASPAGQSAFSPAFAAPPRKPVVLLACAIGLPIVTFVGGLLIGLAWNKPGVAPMTPPGEPTAVKTEPATPVPPPKEPDVPKSPRELPKADPDTWDKPKPPTTQVATTHPREVVKPPVATTKPDPTVKVATTGPDKPILAHVPAELDKAPKVDLSDCPGVAKLALETPGGTTDEFTKVGEKVKLFINSSADGVLTVQRSSSGEIGNIDAMKMSIVNGQLSFLPIKPSFGKLEPDQLDLLKVSHINASTADGKVLKRVLLRPLQSLEHRWNVGKAVKPLLDYPEGFSLKLSVRPPKDFNMKSSDSDRTFTLTRDFRFGVQMVVTVRHDIKKPKDKDSVEITSNEADIAAFRDRKLKFTNDLADLSGQIEQLQKKLAAIPQKRDAINNRKDADEVKKQLLKELQAEERNLRERKEGAPAKDGSPAVEGLDQKRAAVEANIKKTDECATAIEALNQARVEGIVVTCTDASGFEVFVIKFKSKAEGN